MKSSTMPASAPRTGFAGRLDYAQTLAILKSNDLIAQKRLAEDVEAPPEALYYLAEHGAPSVRAAVVLNPSTPVQADALLARDETESVRAELARRIHRLLPHLTEGARAQLREQAIAIMEALASDQAVRVRALLAETIKADPRFPRAIAYRLAHDPEFVVCGPILEYSPLLNDTDLTEIIATSQSSGVAACIARRAQLSETVADAVARTADVTAVAALLGNANAQIREDTLDAILDGAPMVEEWHQPLVLRANLSIRAVRRIAGFVAAQLVEQLVETQGISDDLARELLQTVRKQITEAPADAMTQEAAEREAQAIVRSGRFNSQWVQEMAPQRRQNPVIIAALGLASHLGVPLARQIVGSRTGRAIAALCWKAGVSARAAYDVQQHVAHVAPALMVTPRNGSDYPMTPDQMNWLLETFLDN